MEQVTVLKTSSDQQVRELEQHLHKMTSNHDLTCVNIDFLNSQLQKAASDPSQNESLKGQLKVYVCHKSEFEGQVSAIAGQVEQMQQREFDANAQTLAEQQEVEAARQSALKACKAAEEAHNQLLQEQEVLKVAQELVKLAIENKELAEGQMWALITRRNYFSQ
ncbi:hypothetical protein L218DRAFT_468876 [Marasmius fiardii PR-910]|nr:hypothetical protein L218DRAFT_468876 [Marasmius fiardii PR-910]